MLFPKPLVGRLGYTRKNLAVTLSFHQFRDSASVPASMHARYGKFLSCDWGTSSFRLRLIEQGRILQEYTDQQGCRAIYDAYPREERVSGFEKHLQTVLNRFPIEGAALPLVISGMASSTIGWRELPYARLPLALDGSSVTVDRISWNSPRNVKETHLISGAASEDEMMRGEECEAIGLAQVLPSFPRAATLVLPGTHSKHLTVQDGHVTRIQTFMTGEIYEVLSRHSILRTSVQSGGPTDRSAFRSGVRKAAELGLAASLFQTRTRHVLKRYPAESNGWFLSGVLIGSELQNLDPGRPMLLGGIDSIRQLYAHAAEELRLEILHVFSTEEVQQAVPWAHGMILTQVIR